MHGTDVIWIESNPNVLGGKPHVRGTRLSVEFILVRGSAHAAWTFEASAKMAQE